MYIKDSWTYRVSFSRRKPASIVEIEEDFLDSHDSYAVGDYSRVLAGLCPKVRDSETGRSLKSCDPALQRQLDRISALSGDNVMLERDPADCDKLIVQLEDKLPELRTQASAVSYSASRARFIVVLLSSSVAH